MTNNLKNIKKVYIFGNPDLDIDSLPIKIMDKLEKALPKISFEIKDPNEEWDIPEKLIVIDTVIGIKEIQIFYDIDHFEETPNMTVHDFDALSNLRYMKKLGKLQKIMIIGIPALYDPQKAIDKIVEILDGE